MTKVTIDCELQPEGEGLELVASQFPEINFSNYGQDEVEALQAWGFTALDAMADAQRAIAELREECGRVKSENDHLARHINKMITERDTLRQQRDKLADLLKRAHGFTSADSSLLYEEIKATLAEVGG